MTVKLVCAAVLIAVCAVSASANVDARASGDGLIPMLAVSGKPTEAEVRAKVASIHAQRIKSFLIYARSGLEVEYMGDEWLSLCEWFCDEAEKRGMKVWLYDEYNWPSGTCKGRVPNENDAWRYAEYGVFRDSDGKCRWASALAPAGWVNVCEPDAVARFIEQTHDVYAKRLARWFANKTILGIFTDEPGHPVGVTFPDGKPIVSFRKWSGLEAEYHAATGRDLKTDVEKWVETKEGDVWSVYLDLMGKRFCSSYFDQIRAWCDRHGILLTGHLICENYIFGSLRFNGNPILCLKGESLPGMDEIGTAIDADPEARPLIEWVTYNLARQAVLHRGNGGLAELFACGPPGHVPATLRFMLWMCAFHGIDHYVACMDSMDMKGLVEKHGYLAPASPIQPWYERYANVLADEARIAAEWARKSVSEREVAVRYPITTTARMVFSEPEKDASGLDLHERFYGLLRTLEVNQMTCRLIDEDEATSLPLVFSFRADGELVEERTHTTGLDEDGVLALCRERLPTTFVVSEQSGEMAKDLLVRTFSDGSSAVLNLQPFSDRTLVAERGAKRLVFNLPARGVVRFDSNALPPQSVVPTAVHSLAGVEWELSLSAPNVRRINFDEAKRGALTVAGVLKDMRLVTRECAMSYAVTSSGRPVGLNEQPAEGVQVIRHVAEPYAFEMNGNRVVPKDSCTLLRPGYNSLYRQTEQFDLAGGVHRFAIASGEADQNFFLPALFVAGDFVVFNGVLMPRPHGTVKLGSLAACGLGDFTGTATWSADVKAPIATRVRLRLSTGGRVTNVKFAGRDLGVRAWEPFEWELPEECIGTEGRLEISVSTSVRPMFGDISAGKWDNVRIWFSVDAPDGPCGLLDADWIVPSAGNCNERKPLRAPSCAFATVEMQPGEHWWGVCNSFGTNMPFTVETRDFKADLFACNYEGQPASLLLSDQGRVVWCSEQTRVSINGGVIAMESDGADVTQEQGGANLREAYAYALSRHFPPSGKMPDPLFFSAPQYNTWMELTYNQNEKDILAYAQSMLDNGLPPGVLMIDDTWQENYGVWEFAPRKFADPRGMCDQLHKMGFKVLLWVVPFVSLDSQPYRDLTKHGRTYTPGKGGFILDAKTGAPVHVSWWNGYSAILDLTDPVGDKWFRAQLDRLRNDYGVDGFKFDGGHFQYYPATNRIVHAKGASGARQVHAYSVYAEDYPTSEHRCVWGMAGRPIMVRLPDKGNTWPEVRRLVPDMLAAGLLGYPFICPDMIGGGSWTAYLPGSKTPYDKELFIRSAQVHALCPMMQFSVSPWQLMKDDPDGQRIIRDLVALRQRFSPKFVELARRSGETGEPMMRSMEYAYPRMGYAEISNQFLMGDDLLVAPVIEKGAKSRRVVIPPGRWRGDDGKTVEGPASIEVPTPLERLPYFERVSF